MAPFQFDSEAETSELEPLSRLRHLLPRSGRAAYGNNLPFSVDDVIRKVNGFGVKLKVDFPLGVAAGCYLHKTDLLVQRVVRDVTLT